MHDQLLMRRGGVLYYRPEAIWHTSRTTPYDLFFGPANLRDLISEGSKHGIRPAPQRHSRREIMLIILLALTILGQAYTEIVDLVHAQSGAGLLCVTSPAPAGALPRNAVLQPTSRTT